MSEQRKRVQPIEQTTDVAGESHEVLTEFNSWEDVKNNTPSKAHPSLIDDEENYIGDPIWKEYDEMVDEAIDDYKRLITRSLMKYEDTSTIGGQKIFSDRMKRATIFTDTKVRQDWLNQIRMEKDPEDSSKITVHLPEGATDFNFCKCYIETSFARVGCQPKGGNLQELECNEPTFEHLENINVASPTKDFIPSKNEHHTGLILGKHFKHDEVANDYPTSLNPNELELCRAHLDDMFEIFTQNQAMAEDYPIDHRLFNIFTIQRDRVEAHRESLKRKQERLRLEEERAQRQRGQVREQQEQIEETFDFQFDFDDE